MNNNNLFTYLDTYDIVPCSDKICCDNIKNNYYHKDIIKCKQCASTICNIIDLPEWRNYNSNISINENRCGMPLNELLPSSSIGTTIKNNYKSSKSMSQVIRYQQWNSMTYKERSIYKVFTEISSIGKKYDLPLIIINEAKALYKLISDIKISRGSNRKGIIASSIYFSCKTCGYPRSSKEIANICNIKSNSYNLASQIRK